MSQWISLKTWILLIKGYNLLFFFVDKFHLKIFYEQNRSIKVNSGQFPANIYNFAHKNQNIGGSLKIYFLGLWKPICVNTILKKFKKTVQKTCRRSIGKKFECIWYSKTLNYTISLYCPMSKIWALKKTGGEKTRRFTKTT